MTPNNEIGLDKCKYAGKFRDVVLNWDSRWERLGFPPRMLLVRAEILDTLRRVKYLRPDV